MFNRKSTSQLNLKFIRSMSTRRGVQLNRNYYHLHVRPSNLLRIFKKLKHSLQKHFFIIVKYYFCFQFEPSWNGNEIEQPSHSQSLIYIQNHHYCSPSKCAMCMIFFFAYINRYSTIFLISNYRFKSNLFQTQCIALCRPVFP